MASQGYILLSAPAWCLYGCGFRSVRGRFPKEAELLRTWGRTTPNLGDMVNTNSYVPSGIIKSAFSSVEQRIASLPIWRVIVPWTALPSRLFRIRLIFIDIFVIFWSEAIFCKESNRNDLSVLLSGFGDQYVWMLAYKRTDGHVH